MGPYNGVIILISQEKKFENIQQGITFEVEIDGKQDFKKKQ